MFNAVGAGNYGSIGGTTNASTTAKPATGNSKLFPAKSASGLNSLAKAQTEQFISNAKRVAQGAAGASRINIKV